MAITKVSPGLLDLDSGITITVTDNSDNLTLVSTDADASVGPNLNLYRNSGSPADSDVLGVVTFNGRNDNSQDVIYARQLSYITDASDGTEDGTFKLQTMVGGTIRDRLNITPSEINLNEDSQDVDFRVESDGNANMLFVDGGNNKVGIGTASPSSILHIEGDTNSYAAAPILYFGSTSTANAAIRDWAIGPADDAYGNFHIFRGTSTGSDPIGNDGRVFTIASAGGVRIGDSVGTGYALTADIGTQYGAIIQTTESTPSANPAFWVRLDDDGSVEELFRVQNNGLVRAKNGIHFGTDTAAANALDDYEEGTWTASAGNGEITMSSGSGEYTKIGNVVYFTLSLKIRQNSSSSNQVQIAGLPFSGTGGILQFTRFEPTGIAYQWINGDISGTSIYFTRPAGTAPGTSGGVNNNAGQVLEVDDISTTTNDALQGVTGFGWYKV